MKIEKSAFKFQEEAILALHTNLQRQDQGQISSFVACITSFTRKEMDIYCLLEQMQKRCGETFLLSLVHFFLKQKIPKTFFVRLGMDPCLLNQQNKPSSQARHKTKEQCFEKVQSFLANGHLKNGNSPASKRVSRKPVNAAANGSAANGTADGDMDDAEAQSTTKSSIAGHKRRKSKEDDEDEYSDSPSCSKSAKSGSGKQKRGGRSTPEKWTPEEDVLLLELVKKYPDRNEQYSRWTVIARQIGNKTSSQCFQHWERVLNPEIKKGPWNLEEELLLLTLCEEFGKHKVAWAEVASSVPGRTDTQCRYHYLKIMKSKKVKWTKDEDRILESLCRDLKVVDWMDLSKRLFASLLKSPTTKYKTPPRPPVECKIRWEENHVNK